MTASEFEKNTNIGPIDLHPSRLLRLGHPADHELPQLAEDAGVQLLALGGGWGRSGLQRGREEEIYRSNLGQHRPSGGKICRHVRSAPRVSIPSLDP